MVSRTLYRKLLDCQNEEVVERDDGAEHPLLDIDELRELKIRLNPPLATNADVAFLLRQLDDARVQLAEVVVRLGANYAVAAAIDVDAWLAANPRPAPAHPLLQAIAALDRPYSPQM
jgi:hypothetical protein